MSRLPVFLISIVVSFFIVSCSPPVGYIQSNSSAGHDDFWIVSQRNVYNLGDAFERASDLRVFTSSRGTVRSIPVGDVEIRLIKNPDAAIPDEPISINNGRYTLVESVVGAGRKLIIVSYGDKAAEYSIEVLDPYGVGNGGNGNGEGNGGSGIGVTWQ